MSKEALVDRLITAERILAEQRERWLSQQDEALTWQLRAEAAEAQLQEKKLRRSSSVDQKTESAHLGI
jgi:hypothetical protein